MHSGFWLVVNMFAVYRLAILTSKDKITDPIRKLVKRCGWRMVLMKDKPGRWLWEKKETRRGRAGRWLYELVICPWCVSIWWAAMVIAITRLAPALWLYPALLLAVSGFTVLGTRRE